MAHSSTTWSPEKARSAYERSAIVRAERASSGQENGKPERVETAKPAAFSESFIAARLSRVRAQLVRLDQMLAKARSSKKIKELADATTRLQAQEQQLAGRPGPGTLKPVQPGNPRASSQPQAIPLPSPAKQGEPAPAVSEHLPSSRPALHRAQLPKVDHPSTPSDQEAPDQPIDYGPLD